MTAKLKLIAGTSLLVVTGSLFAATLPAGFSESVVASDIANGTAMAFSPDGRLFVCQQGGALRVIKDNTLLSTPFVTMTVDPGGERGLLGVAFDPDFANNQWVYVYYTVPGSPPHNRVSRLTSEGDVAMAGSETVILELDNLGPYNHNGGALHFGSDGKLYIAVGENAYPFHSQTLANLHGKILRIDASGTIPVDNPFYNTATGVNRAIWALGLRNPFTFGFQPVTGKMFINDVGQGSWEEINEGLPGANYGWPNCEGGCGSPSPDYTDPIYQYSRDGGCAIVGGTFYNPVNSQFPAAYVGRYFFADLCGGWIRTLDPNNGNQITTFAAGLSNPVDLRVSADGSLYYLDRAHGSVFRVQFASAPSITLHPKNHTVPSGGSVTLTVAASGAEPFFYQWQRDGVDIPGANSISYTVSVVQAGESGSTFRCRVSNAFGSIVSNPARLVVNNNQPPVATILTPANGSRYSAGNTVSFSGSASDPEDGNLPASAFSWTVVFHHEQHTHPFLGPVGNTTSGIFSIPTSGETAANVFYRIRLTVTDSAGVQSSTFVDLLPNVVTLTLATKPAGLQLTLDGQPITAPVTVQSVVGMTRTIGALSSQRMGKVNYSSLGWSGLHAWLQGLTGRPGKVNYSFLGWSDGGARTHNVITPAANASYRAIYRKKDGGRP